MKQQKLKNSDKLEMIQKVLDNKKVFLYDEINTDKDKIKEIKYILTL